ncbi:MAG TPA: Hsp20/alpha crystallin family protein [Chryseosolibacter sp.]|nr:Hsp20/alpha crystallin family protein [Chryseosolibacter sp.]
MKARRKSELNSAPAWTESPWRLSSLFTDPSEVPDRRPAFEDSGVSTPAVNIIETRENLRVEMVAPGMKKDAFTVTLQDSVLTISYDHDDNREGERRDWKYRVHEYNYQSFVRSFYLPDTLETEAIEASYTDGILALRIPKKKEAIARQIHVE